VRPPAALVLAAFAALAVACAPPAPPLPAPSAPTVDEAVVQRGVTAALLALAKRRYNVTGCDAAEARLVPEAEVRGAPAAGACTVRVARQRDNTWLVVVRSASQPDTPRAFVTVSPGGEGAQHIDYVY
jgi:hypothetical protein